MGSISVNKLGGLSLIVGPLLSLIFFLIQPGGTLIDRADLSDSVGTITSLASNAGLSNISAIAIAFGLIVTTFGLYVLQAGIRDGGNGDALSRAGFVLVLFGNVGWVLAQALTLTLADAHGPEAMQAAVPVYHVKLGIVLMSGLAVALGFIVFSLALSMREDLNKIAARLVAALSAVVLVTYLVGILDNNQLDAMISIARVCYVGWAIWTITLGVGLLKAGAPASEG